MAKTKKQKRAEQNEARRQKQAGKKDKSKTAVANAMEKAEQVKAEKTSQTRIVTGFNSRSVNSNIIHALTSDGLLCDSRVKIAADEKYTVNDISCKRCASYSVVKQLLAATKTNDSAKEPAKTEPKKEPEKAEDKSNESAMASQPEDDSCTEDEIFENLKNILQVRMKSMEDRLLKKLETFCQELLQKRPEYFLVSSGNDHYQVIHDPSRLVIASGCTQNIAEHILLELCDQPFKWNGFEPIPKTWVSAIRKITQKWIAQQKEQIGNKSTPQEGILKHRRKRKRTIKKETDNEPKLQVRRRRR